MDQTWDAADLDLLAAEGSGEVLKWVCETLTYGEIAERMFISRYS